MQGEANDVELIERGACFDGEERDLVGEHLRFHIGGGGEGSFAIGIGAGIDDMIENF